MPCSLAGGTTIAARSTFGRRLRRLAYIELALLSTLLVPSALAETATAALSASASIVNFGQAVTVSGSIAADPGCLGGRNVTLQWQPADSSALSNVATGRTAADGSFTFEQTQPNTGNYGATIEGNASCLASTTNQVLVRVRAMVDAALVADPTEAGSCVDVSVSVQPERPGQIVELQRRTGQGWRLLEPLTLDPASQALASPCFTSEDAGVVRLRVRWVAQDTLNATGTSPVLAFEVSKARWMLEIDHAIGTRRVSVAVGEDDTFLYERGASTPRIPASNEKLLLSMTLYDTLGSEFRIQTSVASSGGSSGAVRNLWILGRGDPGVTGATIGTLAHRVADAGIERVRGRVFGSRGYFRRDWDAPGWNAEAHDSVNRPTALVFERNKDADPEREAAEMLTRKLEALGVRVGGRPGSGSPPGGLETIASVTSPPLQRLITKMLRPSDNFMAETLGKRLGVETRGVPGTIAKGAAAIEGWTDDHGTGFTLNDNSGLSYANRVTAEGIVRLLWFAEDQPWGPDLRRALPTGGQGTLRHRLRGVDVRAKTGTLDDVSALSGWVKARSGDWVEFSVLSFGMSKSTASAIEDRIVMILQDRLG
ncbi:MAG TPA: D-alanyl-D-alanine carboxypeptidase [Actinomycetota bacterium]|nr:D-alanyl-D-alanine carboxypeptidase [Actinomycetota bacterium]